LRLNSFIIIGKHLSARLKLRLIAFHPFNGQEPSTSFRHE
jgi:hypothetical protein